MSTKQSPPKSQDPFETLADGWEKGGLDDWDPCIALFDEWLHEHYYGRGRKRVTLADLAGERQWVAWREELRDGALTKVPKNPATGGNAQVPTNPKTYGTRAQAERRGQRIRRTAKGGFGIMLGPLPNGEHLAGIDLDSCRDPESGALAPWAQGVIERFNTYAEVSPSCTGVKLFYRVSERGIGKLRTLIGNNVEGKPLTRKAFPAGKHREVAIDTARFYAVTDQRLDGSPMGLRTVAFADVEWFVREAGPSYLAAQRAGNSKDGYADLEEHRIVLDESGSGYGFRFMQQCHAEGMSYEQACAAILADEDEAGEWGNRVDARQLKRAWERSKPQPTPPPEQDRAWPILHPDALHGLAGRIVVMFKPHTEADPVAILIQTLVYFGNMVGRGPYVVREGDHHYTNLYNVLVGDSSKSRKGTAAGRVRQLMSGVSFHGTGVRDWVDDGIKGGMSSGEGLIWVIRDPIIKIDKDGNETVVDEGVSDKRLLLDEREFFSALTVMKREGNIVSRIVRDAWDGRDHIASLTKNSPAHATKPHISIVGHITEDELRVTLDFVSIANGYANRFLFTCVRRSQYLPFGGSLSEATIDNMRKEVEEVFSKWYGVEKEIIMDAKASALWEANYRDLSEGPPGTLGAVTARAEAQTLRLALIYALLDSSDQITVAHLKAAMAVWQYCKDSARYIFGDNIGDPLVDELLRALRNAGELTRTQIRDLFKRNQRSNKIDA
ncbi:MAG: DUF3987 domain-containing protein, partial [Xanthobacteraceae bacterium]